MNQKVLVSLMVIGIVGAVAGGSTLAVFSDSETSSNNLFTAGAIDLKIDWNESYNGEKIEDQPLTDDPGPIFQLNDVKPGDTGEATISFHVYDNPAWIWFRLNVTKDDDNGNTEPELVVDSQDDPNDDFDGELFQNLNFTLWYDDGDNVFEEDETRISTTTTPQGETCEFVDLDVGLTLDESGSMGGSKIDNAKNGSKVLVDTLSAQDQSALISFDGSATLRQELTTNKTAVKNAIDALTAGGSTDIADGVERTHTELINGTNARGNVTKVMVVLSDGQSNAQDAIAAANASQDDGIRVITIAYGSGADFQTLEAMASSPGDAYNASETDVSQVFSDVSQEICTPTGEQEVSLQDGILLDADASTDEPDAFVNSTTRYIGFRWELPFHVGNMVQTDMVQTDMDFYAEQRRNNPNPQNPWTGS